MQQEHSKFHLSSSKDSRSPLRCENLTFLPRFDSFNYWRHNVEAGSMSISGLAALCAIAENRALKTTVGPSPSLRGTHISFGFYNAN